MRSRALGHAFGAAVLLFAVSAAAAQETSGEVISALRDKAVVLDIVARVLDQDDKDVWNAASSKVTIPGRPVSIRLVGTNVVMVVQFTPYKNDDGRQMLVAQGQIWVDTKVSGIHYRTTLQTIPIDFGEKILYFPLGSHKENDEAKIEIQIELKRYAESDKADAATSDKGKPSEAKTTGEAQSPKKGTAPANPGAAGAAKNGSSVETKKPVLQQAPAERPSE